ncbi:MAG: tripartite tricarboxylate transporter substrate binding protein [Betaproteobacteria bacterium]|nr:tripartite tricarboxylate transporter substrate binding protein [Betaproteobacteria bacterium]
MKRLIQRAAAAAMLYSITFTGAAFAQQTYPSKPIRFVVPYPPGGGTDILSRLVTAKMTETIGWQFVVDNRSGAGGNIGIEAAVKAAPDGYTIVMGQTSNLAINPALHRKLPYDSLKDLAPVTLVSSIPIAVMVAAKAPYPSFGDLVKVANAKPDQLVFASPGNGSVAHLTGELLQRTAGIKYIHVPYKGAAQAFPDLLGGRANFFLASVETAMPQVKAGTIRVLAVTSARRSPSLPDVPTVAESGYKGFESSTWFGVLAPTGTPEPIITRLSAEIERVLQMPDVRDRMVDGGGGVKTGPKEFAALLKADHAKWARIVKESGAKVD